MIVTATIGPVGALRRGLVRRAAFELGLKLAEQKSLIDSIFRITGPRDDVHALQQHLQDVADREAAEDHRRYVADMERAEQRRHRWGRILGRGARFHALTREESNQALDLVAEACRRAEYISDDAAERLQRAVGTGADIRNPQLCDETVSTLVSVPFRYLQHDIRRGDIRLPRALGRDILAMRMPMDTWDE